MPELIKSFMGVGSRHDVCRMGPLGSRPGLFWWWWPESPVQRWWRLSHWSQQDRWATIIFWEGGNSPSGKRVLSGRVFNTGSYTGSREGLRRLAWRSLKSCLGMKGILMVLYPDHLHICHHNWKVLMTSFTLKWCTGLWFFQWSPTHSSSHSSDFLYNNYNPSSS